MADEVQAARDGQPQQQQQQQAVSWWQFLRTFAIQVAIFYFISSFFRGQRQPVDQDGQALSPSVNLFSFGQKVDILVYLSMQDTLDRLEMPQLVWQLEEVTYGSWEEGPNSDSTWSNTLHLDVPESVQNNGSWWLHVFVRKSGISIDPSDTDHVAEAIVYQKKMLTKYLKRRVHLTVNLLTGQSNSSATETNMDKDAPVEIISYWHPNLTLNLVADQTPWTRGTIPPPMDQYLVFDNSSDGYYPILYINDYWNLAQDYMPINSTTKTLDLSLMFHPISLFKFQMYAAMTTKNQWSEFLGPTESSDEDQDTLKRTMMETNPYLLALTVVVTIVHSVFEFLAFKNDIQFWRTRESLAGLSVRSVFFNVFQSLIVLLYILDSETNAVIIISCFIGLLIDVWKITKVCKVSLNTENRFLGVLPRITLSDQPSYVESSTKEYDRLAFKYLGWVLFPLFICYGAYSLLYQEHKGWYSFVLGMCYGFLLTFGFITMTPQLFINYKLKSVAHLPWRMLTYKALNTFIDDMFAFVIKMPMMYRIGCFRDDIVFFIFLYQRWIYRVDPRRINEFGTSGDSVATKPGQDPLKNEGEEGDTVPTAGPREGEEGDTVPTAGPREGEEGDTVPTAGPRGGEEGDTVPTAGPRGGERKGGGAVRKRTTGARS